MVVRYLLVWVEQSGRRSFEVEINFIKSYVIPLSAYF